ncbi:MAG TPA: response regulator [Bacteroidales bacterium]|nr:response regulator [Bacteroidales bacterium]HPS62395.1 response regulator [Bacteroidales bacterium]
MKPKILVVDDETSIRLLLENFLSQDYDIIGKSNGLDALEWLETDLPDLIICDIQMPAMDGYEFLATVRQTGYTRHTPVLMLSANDTSKERVKCYKLGAQDYLIKPFNPEELELIIKKNLQPIHYAMQW